MSERERAIAKAVHLSNRLGSKKISRRHKEQMHQELMDVVRDWQLTMDDIEDYAREEHRRHRETVYEG